MSKKKLEVLTDELEKVCCKLEENGMCGDECPFHYYNSHDYSKEACHLIKVKHGLLRLCSGN